MSRPTGAGEIDTLLFGSLDGGAAAFMTAGVKIGLPTLEDDGAVALASLGGGKQGERGPTGARQRWTALGAIVLGDQWFFDWGMVAAFAGPEGSVQTLVDRLGATVRPPQFGLRLHGEVWARPTDTTLLQGTVIAGTAINSIWARAAWGYRLWGAYLGPEVSVYTDASGFRKLNVGLHGTDFAITRFSIRVSTGLQSETDRRTPGPYIAISVWSSL